MLAKLKLNIHWLIIPFIRKTPALVNPPVFRADFSCAGSGFRELFEAYGSKLKQLELGHSPGATEDHFAGRPPFAPYIPQPQSSTLTTATTEEPGRSYGGMRLHSQSGAPALKVLIRGANAEWDWQTPEWIAPHVLLPAHATLELIGVRNLHTRIHEVIEQCENADIAQVERGPKSAGIRDAGEGDWDGEKEIGGWSAHHARCKAVGSTVPLMHIYIAA